MNVTKHSAKFCRAAITSLALFLAACGESSSPGEDEAVIESPNTQSEVSMANTGFKLLRRPVSESGAATTALVREDQSEHIVIVGTPGTDKDFSDIQTIQVFDENESMRVHLSQSGLPTLFSFESGMVFIENYRLNEGLADLEIRSNDGHIFLEPDVDISNFIFETSQANSLPTSSKNAPTKTLATSPNDQHLQAKASETVDPSEAFERLRSVVLAGLSAKRLGDCVVAVKAATATGGLVGSSRAAVTCGGVYEDLEELIRTGRLEVSRDDVVSCVGGDCTEISGSIALDLLDKIIKDMKAIEGYRDWALDAYELIDKEYPEEELRFLGIIEPKRGEPIFGLEFFVDVRASYFANRYSELYWQLFETGSGDGGGLSGIFDRDTSESSRWTTTIMGFGPGTYTLVVRGLRDNEVFEVYSQPVEIKAEQLLSIYEIYTGSRIVVGAEYNHTSTQTVIYFDGNGDKKVRTDTNTIEPSTTNFRISATDYTDPMERGYLITDAPDFPTTITACRNEDTGKWIPKTVSETGTLTGYAGRAGSGSVSGLFSVTESGGINIAMSYQGTFEGYANVRTFSHDVDRNFSVTADGQVSSEITFTYDANVDYGTSYSKSVSEYSKANEDPLSLFSFSRREQLIDPSAVPVECN